MKALVKSLLLRAGYEIKRVGAPVSEAEAIASPLSGVADFERLERAASGIPTMLSRQTAFALYALCYLQGLKGDVVEIGSWQGYSTVFLAQAARDSGNGVVHAIDHFRGNVGKEAQYVVGEPDLSDLRAGFEANLRRLDLWTSVRLHDMPNKEAVRRLEGTRVRMLFVDGDHTKAGVETDIRLFFPLLQPGGLVVFDDCAPHFPGLVEALSDLLATRRTQRAFFYRNTLVLRV